MDCTELVFITQHQQYAERHSASINNRKLWKPLFINRQVRRIFLGDRRYASPTAETRANSQAIYNLHNRGKITWCKVWIEVIGGTDGKSSSKGAFSGAQRRSFARLYRTPACNSMHLSESNSCDTFPLCEEKTMLIRENDLRTRPDSNWHLFVYRGANYSITTSC